MLHQRIANITCRIPAATKQSIKKLSSTSKQIAVRPLNSAKETREALRRTAKRETAIMFPSYNEPAKGLRGYARKIRDMLKYNSVSMHPKTSGWMRLISWIKTGH